MAKADILQLLSDLSRNQADTGIFDYYYAHAVLDLARAGQLVEIDLLTSTREDDSYDVPTDTIDILSIFYADLELTSMDRQEIEAVNMEHWRDEVGVPVGFIQEDEQDQTFRLYPKPSQDSEDFIPIFLSPLGRDYPANGLAILHTVRRDDTQDFFDLPLVFDILAREFSRDSQHRDDTFAKVCQQLAQIFLTYVSNNA